MEKSKFTIKDSYVFFNSSLRNIAKAYEFYSFL